MEYQRLIEEFPALFDNRKATLKLVTDRAAIEAWQGMQRKQLRGSSLPTSWADIGVILDDPYIIVLRDLVEFHDGHRNGYIRIINRADLSGGRGSVVLPMLEGRIILLVQYRHATRAWHLEVPRGFGEPGISAAEQARREIREEIGGEIDELLDLGFMHNNTGMEASRVQLFLARLRSIKEPNQAEGIGDFQLATVDQFEQLIRDAELTDGFSIAAYARAKLRGLL